VGWVWGGVWWGFGCVVFCFFFGLGLVHNSCLGGGWVSGVLGLVGRGVCRFLVVGVGSFLSGWW